VSNFVWIDLGNGRQGLRRVREQEPDNRSHLAAPQVISDSMPPLQSMADGRIYDSKSAMSATTRRMGFTELGNEKLPPRERPKIDRQHVKQTIERATARFERGERA
jgi:hypothetical protein